MYTELFKLCGFETEEIKKERPRIDRALDRAEIGREDIERAEGRVSQYFDTTLLGVRKSLRMWMEQLMDLVLAREEGKKIVYPAYPTVPFISLAANLASDEVYCQTPEIVLDVVMGQIFGKIDPILEAAESHGMPPGLAMCSLNQARVGGIVKGIVPLPDLLLGTGFFCDQTPKTDDFLHEVYGLPMVIMDGCMDSNWDEFPEISPYRLNSLATAIRSGIEACKEVGVNITPEVLDKSVSDFTRLWTALFGLWEFLKADPIPISQVDLGPIWWAATSPERRCITQGFRVIAELTKAAKRRADEGMGVVEKGAPRVLFLSHQSTDMSIMRMIEEAGIAMPQSALVGVTDEQAKSYIETQFATTEEMIANILLAHGLYHSTSGMVKRYRDLCKGWNIDGVLNLYPFSCRAYGVQSMILKKAIEEDPGIPFLSLEGDIWDTRDYSAEALRTRVETFAEMLRAAKAAKAT